MCFRDDEIEITFYKSSGPGGQKRNVTESSVRVRHLPTGIIVVSTSSRSQHRNKQQALDELKRRLAKRRHRPKPRVRTRPSMGAIARRMDSKKRRATLKKNRRPPDPHRD